MAARADVRSAGRCAAQHSARSDFATAPAGLASSLRLCGTGTQEPLWDRLAALRLSRPGSGGIGRHSLRRACTAIGTARPSRRRVARSPVEAMPSIWPNPSRPAGSCVTGWTPSARAPREGLTGGSQEQSDREERAGEDLEPGGRPEHRQERTTLLIASASRTGTIATGNAKSARSDQGRSWTRSRCPAPRPGA